MVGELCTKLECDVFHTLAVKRAYGGNHFHTMLRHRLIYQLLLEFNCLLGLEVLNGFAKLSILLYVLFDGIHQVRSIVEEGANIVHRVLKLVENVLHCFAGHSLYPAHTCGNRTLGDDADHANLTCCLHMATTTEFHAASKLNHTHFVAVLLTEEGDGAKLLGFFYRKVTIFFQWDVLTDFRIHQMLHLTKLLWSHFLKMREVETQIIGGHQ